MVQQKKIHINMRGYWIILAILSCSFTIKAQEPNRILLVNGFLHVGDGTTMESALIGIEKGKVVLIKNALAYPYKREEWDTIIELQGQHIYPGFVAPNSTLGLTEIDAVRATRDYDEVGQYNPHIRSQIAYNVESKVVSTVKTNGVLLTQATPRGGDISGTSSVMALEGWNWEDATIAADDGIHVNWPSSLEYAEGQMHTHNQKRSEQYRKRKQELADFFRLAKSYAYTSKKSTNDVRLDAMIDCFKGSKRVYFHADEIQQLLDIIDFSKELDVAFPVIVGGYDSHLIGRKLKDAKIPVMLTRTHSLPTNDEDPIDLPYRLPVLLQELGVPFCLQNSGDMEAMNARNLPFQAGTAMAHGLTEEQAVRSISLSACEIMGIDKYYGSIETGKSATIFVSKGNALDMRTNDVTLILINGKFASVDNFQKELYLKYSKKYAVEKP
jgi:imidazolonepropionase-like amidohydrolase